MKKKIKLLSLLFVLSGVVACSNEEQIEDKSLFELATVQYDIAANTGSKSNLKRAVSLWTDAAEDERDFKSILALISYYNDIRDQKKFNYWNEFNVLAIQDDLEGKIKGSILVGNRSRAITESKNSIKHMQTYLKKVSKLDEDDFLDLADDVLEFVDNNEAKYSFMCDLAEYHIAIDSKKRQKKIEALLNKAFTAEYIKANEILFNYYLLSLKDSKKAMNTLSRHFNAKLQDVLIPALIKASFVNEADAFLKNYIAESNELAIMSLCDFYKKSAKITDICKVLKLRDSALEKGISDALLKKYSKEIIAYSKANENDSKGLLLASRVYLLDNKELAVECLNKAVALGDSDACLILASIVAKSNKPDDIYQAIILCQKANELGNAKAKDSANVYFSKKVNFEGSSALDKIQSKIDFYTKLLKNGVSMAQAPLQSALNELKTTYINQNKQYFSKVASVFGREVENLEKSYKSLEEAYSNTQKNYNKPSFLKTYASRMESFQSSIKQLEAKMGEAKKYGIDIFANIEGLKDIYLKIKNIEAKHIGFSKQIEDGSFEAECIAKSLVSASGAEVSEEIKVLLGEISKLEKSIAELKSNITEKNQVMIKTKSSTEKSDAAKKVLSEVEKMKELLSQYKATVSSLAAQEGIDTSYIGKCNSLHYNINKEINYIESNAKKNSTSSAKDLFKLF